MLEPTKPKPELPPVPTRTLDESAKTNSDAELDSNSDGETEGGATKE